MAKGDVLQHLFTGFVRLHVLYHAVKEPICGVDMMEELRHHGYKIGPGTLYPLLHGLAEDGYLRCEELKVGGRVRKYYRATARGQKLLEAAQAKLRELVHEVVEDHDAMHERKARRSK